MSLKILFNQDLIRLPHFPDSYHILEEIVRSSFDKLPSAWSLQYCDSEGDLVRLRNTEDLSTLQRDLNFSNHSIRLFVVPISYVDSNKPDVYKVAQTQNQNQLQQYLPTTIQNDTFVPPISSFLKDFQSEDIQTEAILHDIARKTFEEHISSNGSIADLPSTPQLQQNINFRDEERGSHQILDSEIEKMSKRFERQSKSLEKEEISDEPLIPFPEVNEDPVEQSKRSFNDVSSPEDSPKIAVGQHEDEPDEDIQQIEDQERNQQVEPEQGTVSGSEEVDIKQNEARLSDDNLSGEEKNYAEIIKRINEKQIAYKKAKKILKKLAKGNICPEHKEKLRTKLDYYEELLTIEQQEDLRRKINEMVQQCNVREEYKKKKTFQLWSEFFQTNFKDSQSESQPQDLIGILRKLVEHYEVLSEEKKHSFNLDFDGAFEQLEKYLFISNQSEKEKQKHVKVSEMRYKRKNNAQMDSGEVEKNKTIKIQQIFPHDKINLIDKFVLQNPNIPVNALLERYIASKFEQVQFNQNLQNFEQYL